MHVMDGQTDRTIANATLHYVMRPKTEWCVSCTRIHNLLENALL